MRDLARIKAAYDWLTRTNEAAIEEALGRGDTAAVQQLEDAYDMLERGIFVLLFGQFELEVSRVFETARDRRAGNPDWRTRRGWDTPTLSGRRRSRPAWRWSWTDGRPSIAPSFMPTPCAITWRMAGCPEGLSPLTPGR